MYRAWGIFVLSYLLEFAIQTPLKYEIITSAFSSCPWRGTGLISSAEILKFADGYHNVLA